MILVLLIYILHDITNVLSELRKMKNTEKAMINFMSMLATDYKDQFPQVPVAAIAARIQVNIYSKEEDENKYFILNQSHSFRTVLLLHMAHDLNAVIISEQPRPFFVSMCMCVKYNSY